MSDERTRSIGQPPGIVTFLHPSAPGKLTVGDEELCDQWRGRGPILHACKFPCYVRARTRWRESGFIDDSWWLPGGALYLSFGDQADLYLNMIDPPTPLFRLEMFDAALAWLGARLDEGKDVLVHCNQGQSRSPSLAMVYMASRWWRIDGAVPTCAEAIRTMRAHYDRGMGDANYVPGAGLTTFLEEHWETLVRR